MYLNVFYQEISLVMFVDMSNVQSVSAFVPTVSSHIRSLHTSHLLIKSSRICTSHESHFPRFPKSTVLFFLSFRIQCIALRLARLFSQIASENPKKITTNCPHAEFLAVATVCKQFETVAAEFETVAAVAVSCCIRCILVVFCTLVSGRRICTAEVAGSDFSAVWAWSRLPTPVKTFMSWQRIHGMTAWEHGDIIPWLSIGTIVWYYNII